MSCISCEEDSVESYIRIDNANIAIKGCLEHLARLIVLVREGLAAESFIESARKIDMSQND